MPSNDHKTFLDFFKTKAECAAKRARVLHTQYAKPSDMPLQRPSIQVKDETLHPTKSRFLMPKSPNDDIPTADTVNKLTKLAAVRGHIVHWPTKFGSDTQTAGIKNSPAVRVIEMASRGFFL